MAFPNPYTCCAKSPPVAQRIPISLRDRLSEAGRLEATVVDGPLIPKVAESLRRLPWLTTLNAELVDAHKALIDGPQTPLYCKAEAVPESICPYHTEGYDYRSLPVAQRIPTSLRDRLSEDGRLEAALIDDPQSPLYCKAEAYVPEPDVQIPIRAPFRPRPILRVHALNPNQSKSGLRSARAEQRRRNRRIHQRLQFHPSALTAECRYGQEDLDLYPAYTRHEQLKNNSPPTRRRRRSKSSSTPARRPTGGRRKKSRKKSGRKLGRRKSRKC